MNVRVAFQILIGIFPTSFDLPVCLGIVLQGYTGQCSNPLEVKIFKSWFSKQACASHFYDTRSSFVSLCTQLRLASMILHHLEREYHPLYDYCVLWRTRHSKSLISNWFNQPFTCNGRFTIRKITVNQWIKYGVRVPHIIPTAIFFVFVYASCYSCVKRKYACWILVILNIVLHIATHLEISLY